MLYVVVISGYVFANQNLTYTVGPFQSERSAGTWLERWKRKQEPINLEHLAFSLVKVQDPELF